MYGAAFVEVAKLRQFSSKLRNDRIALHCKSNCAASFAGVRILKADRAFVDWPIKSGSRRLLLEWARTQSIVIHVEIPAVNAKKWPVRKTRKSVRCIAIALYTYFLFATWFKYFKTFSWKLVLYYNNSRDSNLSRLSPPSRHRLRHCRH